MIRSKIVNDRDSYFDVTELEFVPCKPNDDICTFST